MKVFAIVFASLAAIGAAVWFFVFKKKDPAIDKQKVQSLTVDAVKDSTSTLPNLPSIDNAVKVAPNLGPAALPLAPVFDDGLSHKDYLLLFIGKLEGIWVNWEKSCNRGSGRKKKGRDQGCIDLNNAKINTLRTLRGKIIAGDDIKTREEAKEIIRKTTDFGYIKNKYGVALSPLFDGDIEQIAVARMEYLNQ
jgi:hypothetical protein